MKTLLRGDADRAKSEASRVLREKEALRERVAALQSAADRATEATETMAHARDQVKLEAMTAASKAQQERDKLVEAEDEIDGLRTRVQMLEEEFALLTAEADQVRGTVELQRGACDRCQEDSDERCSLTQLLFINLTHACSSLYS